MLSTVECSIVLEILATVNKKKLCLDQRTICVKVGNKQQELISEQRESNMCEGRREKQSSPRMKCASVETRTAIECKKTMTQYWIVMAILVCHMIGRAVLNTRSACKSCRMIKLTERVNDDPIRRNDAAI